MAKPDSATLRRLYLDERLTTRQIGSQFGVSNVTIRNWLREFDIPSRTNGRGLAHRGVTPPTADQLREMVHVQHLSYQQIATRYGVHFTAIPHWLAKHDIPRPTPWSTMRKGLVVVPPTADEVRSRYESGQSMTVIGHEFGLSETSIARLCLKYGIEARPGGWQRGRRWTCADGHLARSIYEQRVDDWLSAHGVAHEVEPQIPADRRYKADFLVGNTYVEVWGVTGHAKYDERKRRKVAIYRSGGLTLIEVPASSFRGRGWINRLAPLVEANQG